MNNYRLDYHRGKRCCTNPNCACHAWDGLLTHIVPLPPFQKEDMKEIRRLREHTKQKIEKAKKRKIRNFEISSENDEKLTSKQLEELMFRIEIIG